MYVTRDSGFLRTPAQYRLMEGLEKGRDYYKQIVRGCQKGSWCERGQKLGEGKLKTGGGQRS